MRRVTFTNSSGELLSSHSGLSSWCDLALETHGREGCIFLVGNGASSSMCSHFAADLIKNARLPACVFTDAALLTCVGNDISYEQVFAEPLRRVALARDLLLAISSSGASPNILAAIRAGREAGMTVVTLTGMAADNPARQMGDLNIHVPAQTYALVETVHAALLHIWVDMLVARQQNAAAKHSC